MGLYERSLPAGIKNAIDCCNLDDICLVTLALIVSCGTSCLGDSSRLDACRSTSINSINAGLARRGGITIPAGDDSGEGHKAHGTDVLSHCRMLSIGYQEEDQLDPSRLQDGPKRNPGYQGSASEPKTSLEALRKAISRRGEKRWRGDGYIGAGSA